MKQRGFLCVGLSFLLLVGLLLGTGGASWAATYTVNSTGDEVDANPGDGLCQTASGKCTFRAAVIENNARALSDLGTVNQIQFNIDPSSPNNECDVATGVCTIKPGAVVGSSSSENCSNGVDDDNNGAVDCADSGCSSDPACFHAASECCSQNPSGGCDDPDDPVTAQTPESIEACVCAFDSYCCDVEWDFICVSERNDQCATDVCGETPSGGNKQVSGYSINAPVVIDGCSQPGSNCATLANPENAALTDLASLNLKINFDGVEFFNQDSSGPYFPFQSIFSVRTDDSVIRGLSFQRFNHFGSTISSEGSRNVIEGNFFGLDASGLNSGKPWIALPGQGSQNESNSSINNSQVIEVTGLFSALGSEPSDNVIRLNVITGAIIGIRVEGFPPGDPFGLNPIYDVKRTVVEKNIIGPNKTGQRLVFRDTRDYYSAFDDKVCHFDYYYGNRSAGMTFNNTTDTRISDNLISGNGSDSVTVGGLNLFASSNAVVTGNIFGADITGTQSQWDDYDIPEGQTVNFNSCIIGEKLAPLGNGTTNIVVTGWRNDPVIEGNVIANAGFVGVDYGSRGTGSISLLNNYIGTNWDTPAMAAGTADLGNGLSGVLVSAGNFLRAEANIIAHNAKYSGPISQQASWLVGAVKKKVAPGQLSDRKAYAKIVRRYNALEGFNYRGGVTITPWIFTAHHNVLSKNSIFGNGFTAIDLWGPNQSGRQVANTIVDRNDHLDKDDGPNGAQNSPVLERVAVKPNSVAIRGKIATDPGVPIHVEFFASKKLAPAGNGEAEQYLGSVDVVTDANGRASYNFDGGVVPGEGNIFFSAIATGPLGSSEVSEAITAAKSNGKSILSAPSCISSHDNPSGAKRTPCFGIVNFATGTSPVERESVVRSAKAEMRYNYKHLNNAAVAIKDDAVMDSVMANPKVLGILADREVGKTPVTDFGSGEAGGNDTPQDVSPQEIPLGVAKVRAPEARSQYAVSGSGVGVAIMDTGVDMKHPDLKDSMSASCFDAYNQDCRDREGHGTHVAGILKASDNNLSVVGVAPSAIGYSVRVLDQRGAGTDSAVIAGLDWVLDNANSVSPPIKVVNMSLGRYGSIDECGQGQMCPMQQAIKALKDAGIIVVTSAGNDPYFEVKEQVPAGYPEVISVAASVVTAGINECNGSNPNSVFDNTDHVAFYTTDGKFDPVTKIGVTVSAPGTEAYDRYGNDNGRGCRVAVRGIKSLRMNGGTTYLNGTSMSAPHVSGVIALMAEYMQREGRVLGLDNARCRVREGARNVIGQNGLPSLPIYDVLSAAGTAGSYDFESEGILDAMGALASSQCDAAPGWICNPSYYSDGRLCDQGCGIVDPDCDAGLPSLPSTWTCSRPQYNDGYLCDCACGAVDPDCAIGGASVTGCTPGDTCSSAGTCEPGDPNNWTCPDYYYNAKDGCDCGCGSMKDPDCLDPELPFYDNCNFGETCNPETLQCEGGGGSIPDGWTCPAAWWGDNYCDCSCGVPDELDCSSDQCGGSSGAPDGWTCSPDWWADGYCDCDCGVPDDSDCGPSEC